MTIVTFLFHICLFVAPLFLMGHIVLFDTFHGWSWPALPDGVADTLYRGQGRSYRGGFSSLA